MKKRMCILMLVCCLILTLFPAAPAAATDSTAVMPTTGGETEPASGEDVPDDSGETEPESGEIVLDDSLSELLETYFEELLALGIAGYDDEELERWLSEDTLQTVISRVENLSEQEKSIEDVVFTVTSYDADTGELSAEVTETVDGAPVTTTHTLRLSGDEDGGWRVESDNFMDSVLYDFSVDFGTAAPTPPQTHPNTWKNTGNSARDIAEIALTQEGYREVYAGNVGNYTKYDVWYYGENRPDPWCAMFISWCANQAGIPTSIIKKNALASGFRVSNMQKNRYGAPAYAFGAKAAKCGDIAYIDNNGDGTSNHVGLVYNADANYIYTIEGNLSDKVTKRKFSTKTGRYGNTKTNIVFFARPNYTTTGGGGGGGGTSPVSTLSIATGQNSYKITRGSECDVTGSVTSNYALTEVKATLTDVKTTQNKWSASVPNLKGNSLNIGTSAINDFKGAELPAGSYTLTITAKDSSGKTVSKTVTITVVAAAEISFSPNPVRIEQGTSEAVTIRFQGEDISDLDISSIRASDLVAFKEWREKDFTAGKATLVLEGKRAGTKNFQISLKQGGETLISGGLTVEVYTLDSGIKERFDFEAEVTFQNPANLYREPTDAAPYDRFSQSSCLCNRGVKLDDNSIWLAMTAEYGGGWFRLQDALNVAPVISVSPGTLTLKVGETRTLSVRFGYMPQATAFGVSQYMSDDIITTTRKDLYETLPSESFGTANVELTVQARRVGAVDIHFVLFDRDGETRSSRTCSVQVVSETVMPSDPEITAGKYYYEPIKWAVEHDIIINPSQYFRPSERCTRASAVTFLWRLAGAPAPASKSNPFSDIVPVDSYYNAVLWAVERGITNGTSETKFSPDAYCNRGQIVTFLHRYAGTPAAKGVNSFKDVAKGRFCYDSVNWASAINVTQGFSDNTFHPAEVCTRAQIITFIYRYATGG